MKYLKNNQQISWLLKHSLFAALFDANLLYSDLYRVRIFTVYKLLTNWLVRVCLWEQECQEITGIWTTQAQSHRLWHVELEFYEWFGILNNFLAPCNAIIHKLGSGKVQVSCFIWRVHLSYKQQLIFTQLQRSIKLFCSSFTLREHFSASLSVGATSIPCHDWYRILISHVFFLNIKYKYFFSLCVCMFISRWLARVPLAFFTVKLNHVTVLWDNDLDHTWACLPHSLVPCWHGYLCLSLWLCWFYLLTQTSVCWCVFVFMHRIISFIAVLLDRSVFFFFLHCYK